MSDVKKIAAIALCALMLMGACALADGEWVYSNSHGDIQLAAYAGRYDGWVDIAGYGGVTAGDATSVRIVSRNASVWSKPRTNSTKLGSAQHGEKLTGVLDGYGNVVEQDGFYAVRYKNREGWGNSAYAVLAPLEIVLMQGNVPAYCAPDRASKRVGSLNKLTRYTVLGFYDDFYVVSLREAAAFIPMSVRHYDSTFERYYHAGWSGRGQTTCKTTVRTGPGDDYASVRDISGGHSFQYMDVIDGWCLIYDDDSGCYAYIDAGDTNVWDY